MKNKKGFTLLEILLVVGIIAILTGIVILAINPARQLAFARNTQRVSDLKQINNAIQQYYIDNGYYPSDISTTTLEEICETGATSSPHDIDCTGLTDLSVLVPTYITSMPVDPLDSSFSLISKAYASISGTGYDILLDENGNLILVAPLAELDALIGLGTSTFFTFGPLEMPTYDDPDACEIILADGYGSKYLFSNTIKRLVAVEGKKINFHTITQSNNAVTIGADINRAITRITSDVNKEGDILIATHSIGSIAAFGYAFLTGQSRLTYELYDPPYNVACSEPPAWFLRLPGVRSAQWVANISSIMLANDNNIASSTSIINWSNGYEQYCLPRILPDILSFSSQLEFNANQTALHSTFTEAKLAATTNWINANCPSTGEETPVDACGTSGDATDSDCWSTAVDLALTWGPMMGTTTNAKSNTDGKTNTVTLIQREIDYSESYPIARYCYNLTEGGVPAGTWYLPAINQLVDGLTAQFINSPATVSGFPDDINYWSSTEFSFFPDYVLIAGVYQGDVYSGDEHYEGKTYNLDSYLIRCLR